MEKAEDLVLGLMQDKDYRPEKQEDLVKKLRKKSKTAHDWKKVLQRLEKEGQIVRNRSGKIGLPHQLGFNVGELQIHPKGFGFLLRENGQDDIFIERDSMGGAMHGDQVLVRLFGKDLMARRPEGEIVRVLERANKTLVGTFQKIRDHGFVIPDNPRILDHILISAEDVMNAEENQKVLVEITTWPEEMRLPSGKILNIIGAVGDETAERNAVLLKNGIRTEFPKEVLAEVEQIVAESGATLEREDLRDLFTVTIDGEDAKDLDDAVSLEKRPDGLFRLGVHIADVSHYVRRGKPLDQEARARGTSVYLVGHVVPMLPAKLSNDLCSLNPAEDKLTISIFLELDAHANVMDYRVASTICRIDHRLTYEGVSAMLERLVDGKEPSDSLAELVKNLDFISQKLREQRFHAGSIDFDLSESKVTVDDEGRVVNIRRAENLPAHRIIEECMLLANKTVAEHLEKRQLPALYRIHEAPGEAAYEELKIILKGFGLDVRGKKLRSGKAIQRILEKSYEGKEGPVIRRAILQAMERARYAEESLGHFGLGFKHYTHFTSPIRRYPDLIVHRALKASTGIEAKEVKQGKLKKSDMARIAEETSRLERAAAEAENEWLDRKKAEYMQNHVGDEFPGIISGVTGFGMFVELENTVEGLVHISNMDDDYYVYDEKSMSLKGQSNRTTYRIGDEVTVQVTKVDVQGRKIDFTLVG